MQKTSTIHLPSVLQLLVSGLGLTFFLPAALGVLAMGLLSLLGGGLNGPEPLPLFSLAWVMGLSGILMVPSLAYALARLLNKPLPDWKLANPLRAANRAMLLWPLAIGIGMLSANHATLALLVLPVIQIVALGLPLWWLVEHGRAGLKTGTPQRNWGMVSFGLTVTATLTLVAELLVLAAAGLLVGAWLSTQPELLEELNRIGQRLVYSQMNPVVIERILTPILSNPGVLFGIIAFSAGIVPLIEELIKPIVLWGFIGKRLSPAEGFALGAICGATFALFESLGMLLSPQAAESWGLLILGRAGTGILHTVTSAMMGWGLASAWSERKYWSLGAAYLIAVSMHGVWNLFGMLSGFGMLIAPDAGAAGLNLAARLGTIAPAALLVLAGILLAMFFGFNRRLRPDDQTVPQPTVE